MACFSPLVAFVDGETEGGKKNIVFKAPAGTEALSLPCGKCVGCRLRYSLQWAIRCVHEAQLNENNCFLTLTYNEDNLPRDGMLNVKVYQDFMKRLRKCHTEQLYSQYGDNWKQYFKSIRYYHAGEYGSKFGRPHYHALIFGIDFDDKVLYSVRNGNNLYTSKKLEQIWPFGYNSIGQVDFESAAYVARYCMKKALQLDRFLYEKFDGTRYQIDKKSGEMKVAEYTTMSKGIGRKWFEKFGDDVYPSDEVIWDGRSLPPPRFYDNLLDKIDPDLLDALKLKRKDKVKFSESTDDRLRVKEEVTKAMITLLSRPLED